MFPFPAFYIGMLKRQILCIKGHTNFVCKYVGCEEAVTYVIRFIGDGTGLYVYAGYGNGYICVVLPCK